jgi:hypothetical protein
MRRASLLFEMHAGKNATMGMGRYDVVFSGGETGRETTNLN